MSFVCQFFGATHERLRLVSIIEPAERQDKVTVTANCKANVISCQTDAVNRATAHRDLHSAMIDADRVLQKCYGRRILNLGLAPIGALPGETREQEVPADAGHGCDHGRQEQRVIRIITRALEG